MTAIDRFSVVPNRSTGADTFSADMDQHLSEWNPIIDQTNVALSEVEAALVASLLGVTTVSTTSLTLGAATHALTVEPGKGFVPGMPLRLARTSAPGAYRMDGTVLTYNSPTGALSLTVAASGVTGAGTFTDWTVSFAIPGASAPTITYEARTTNTMIGAGDAGKLIEITSGTFTQTLDSAATVGPKFSFFYKASSTGTITLDPSGAETVDGVASGVVKGLYLVESNGVGWVTTRLGSATTQVLLTSGTSWAVPLGVRTVKVRGQGAGAVGTSSSYAVGGSGGYFEDIDAVVPGSSITYAIGAASSADAVAGGTTTWASKWSALGGNTANSNVGIGGSATGATVLIPGQPGVSSATPIGGSCPLGVGAYGATRAAAGYGAGGVFSGSAQAARPGCIILEY